MPGLISFFRKFFGTVNERRLKPLSVFVEAINKLEPEIQAWPDSRLVARIGEMRKQAQTGTKLDDLLPACFGIVRETAKRTLGQRHFDVQLLGGAALHKGMIAEMKTGEGKTLAATLAVVLNALPGKGVHVVTVNDYLARRDAEWMGQIYQFLGLTTGCVVPDMEKNARRDAYQCDITYGTNNEYGFDYLRDNLVMSLAERVQRGHFFAIVDEVDSILIDEARTPLIISGAVQDQSQMYQTVDQMIPLLTKDDYEIDEKSRTASLTDSGTERAEEYLRKQELLLGESLYEIENVSLVHHINRALLAHKLFHNDQQYIVKGEKIIIIDEFTGRMMPGRRYSDGLHQAIEAKEKVPIMPENQTLAQTSFQNYFRLYDKLAGMTGTAATEADEFAATYRLPVLEIPTHLPVNREDCHDQIYRTVDEKYAAIVKEIAAAQKIGQPVLVGTTSIEKSEYLSSLLKKKHISHQILNARYHAQEAQIIAQSGRVKTVTIATNMAGRGTDIQLGGNGEMRIGEAVEKLTPDVREDATKRQKIEEKIRQETEMEKREVILAGGLYVIGSERHESRRIDNQLRGRSGRQGDAGKSKFFISIHDDLMRIFGHERIDSMLGKLGLREGDALIHPWLNRAIEKAQQKVEARNFEVRKTMLRFDDVINDQRKVIFEQRTSIMNLDDPSEIAKEMRETAIRDLVEEYISPNSYPEQWNIEELGQRLGDLIGAPVAMDAWAREDGIDGPEICKKVGRQAETRAARRASEFNPLLMRQIEKTVILQTLDQLWREHIVQMEHLSKVIGLRGYGQRDPLNEYKGEGFALFEAMLNRLRSSVTQALMNLQLQADPQAGERQLVAEELSKIEINPDKMIARKAMADFVTNGALDGSRQQDPASPSAVNGQVVVKHFDSEDPQSWGKVGRNTMCPCGSGKKYKRCHGQLV